MKAGATPEWNKRIASETIEVRELQWQVGHFAFSVSPDEVDRLHNHILNQKARHRQQGLVDRLKMCDVTVIRHEHK